MNIIYAKQNFPMTTSASIFLAGPTPRSANVNSWRPEAIEILSRLGYSGDIFVPEPENGIFSHEYDEQVHWELEGLERADVIVFWIPRNMVDMPALTTNVEFGLWIKSGKCVLGFPPDAEKMRYLSHHAKEMDMNITHTLEETLSEALQLIGPGSIRNRGECTVPLSIWNTSHFQSWYEDLKKAGNTLNDSKVLWSFIPKPGCVKPFFLAMWTNVRVEQENRNKEIEVVISRPHTSSVVMYKPHKEWLDTELILVREFRSPVSNKDGYVWELPGGSDPSDAVDPRIVAINEIREETSLNIEINRLIFENTRQQAATILSSKTSLYSVVLTEEEINHAKSLKGISFGDHSSTEYTYVEVVTLRDIIEHDYVDWSNVGMIAQVISQK